MQDPWGKPFRHPDLPGGRYFQTPSCMDCDHYRVAGMPNRMCVKHPKKHIYAGGMNPEGERLENGVVQAEECPDWHLAAECLDPERLWAKPYRPNGKRYHETPSCLDCAHFRSYNRKCKCVVHPDWNFARIMTPTAERAENGVVLAEGCHDWLLDHEET